MTHFGLRVQETARAGGAAGTEYYALSEVEELLAAGERPTCLVEPRGPVFKPARGSWSWCIELLVLQEPVIVQELPEVPFPLW